MRWVAMALAVVLSGGTGLCQEQTEGQRALKEIGEREREDPEAALQAYRQLMRDTQEPGIGGQAAWGAMRLLAARLGRPEEALELYDELSAQSGPAASEGLTYVLLESCGPEATQALIALLEARTAAQPSSRSDWVALAAARGHAEQWDGCVTAWQRALRLEATPTAQRRLGLALLSAGRHEEALAAAAELTDAHPWLWTEARFEIMGPALLALGRLDDVRELADDLAAEEEWAPPQETLVRFYQAAGAHEQAIALLQRLIEQAKPETYHYHALMRRLAEAYAAAGEPDGAYRQYKATAADGDYEAANFLVEHHAERLLDPAEFDSFLSAVFNEDASTYRWRANEICSRLDKAGKLDDLLAAVQAGLAKTPNSPPLLCLLMYMQDHGMEYAAEAETASRLYQAAPDAVGACTVAGCYAIVEDYATALQWMEKGEVSEWPLYCAGLLVKCCQQLGCMDKLEGYAARIREAPGDKRRWAFLEGDLWLEAGQAERAVPLLEAARGLEEQQVVGSDSLARAYAAANRVEDAIAEYEARLKGPGASMIDRRGLLQLYRQHYAPAEYVPRLTAVLRACRPLTYQPEAICSLWQSGIVRPEQEAQRLPELAAALEAECAANATDPFPWVGLGLTQLAQRQPEAASASLARVAALDTTGRIRQPLTDTYDQVLKLQAVEDRQERCTRANEEYRLQLRPALEAGDCARAAEIACVFLDCLGSRSLDADTRLAMAVQIAGSAAGARRTEDYMAALLARLKADPEDAYAVEALVGCYTQQKRDEDVVTFLEGTPSAMQRDPLLCAALGDAHGRLGRVPEAEQAYKHLLELSPRNWQDALRLGWVYVRNERLPEAEAWADKALEWVEAGNDRPLVAFGAAKLLAQCGAADKAAEAATKAVERSPENGWTLQEAAKVYRQLERWDDVAAVCRKAPEVTVATSCRDELERMLQEAEAHGAQPPKVNADGG